MCVHDYLGSVLFGYIFFHKLQLFLSCGFYMILQKVRIFKFQGTKLQTLAIPGDVLVPGVQYMLTLNASYSEEEGSAEVYTQFTTNFPPYGGTCNYSIETSMLMYTSILIFSIVYLQSYQGDLFRVAVVCHRLLTFELIRKYMMSIKIVNFSILRKGYQALGQGPNWNAMGKCIYNVKSKYCIFYFYGL